MLKNSSDNKNNKSGVNVAGAYDAHNGPVTDNDSDADGTVSAASVENTLCVYISTKLLPPDYGVELKSNDDLLSIDCLDSMQFMRLAQFVEESYELKIPAEDLLIENFQTVKNLTAYIVDRLSVE